MEPDRSSHLAPKVPEDFLPDEEGGWCLSMKPIPKFLPPREPIANGEVQQQTDHDLANKVSELSILEKDAETKEDSGEFEWSFRSINFDETTGEEQCEEAGGMKRNHPGTPCSPAMLQKKFSWGYLNVGAKKKRPESFSHTPPSALATAPRLPNDDEIHERESERSLLGEGLPAWGPTPCFSPLAGRTTLARYVPRILGGFDQDSTPTNRPSNEGSSSSITAEENSQAFPPPALPDSPEFQNRSTSIPLRMKRGESSAFL